jgi:tryptophan synthase beta subunit
LYFEGQLLVQDRESLAATFVRGIGVSRRVASRTANRATPSLSASRAPNMSGSDLVIVNISGRGAKDIGILRENLAL